MLAPVTDLFLLDDKNSPYHPIKCAVMLHSEQCTRILLHQEFYKLYFTENPNATPFIYDIKIRPAILFIKTFPECFKQWILKDRRAIQNLYSNSLMLLLILRHASRLACLDFLPQPHDQDKKMFIASAKYTHPGFTQTKTDKNILHGEPHSVSNKYDPMYVHKKFMNAYLFLLTSRGNDSLQNLCRWNVVLQLISSDNYTCEVIKTQLKIPTLLQQYLMFGENEWSESLMNASQEVIDDERKLDQLIEEVTID
ncbi:hypothetical protein ACF0H5_012083 [Mactra antiquata]